jgi:hypothetical protein
MLADRVELICCVKVNVCAAEREQSRRRGRESDCTSSHTELGREDIEPCEILISFLFVLCLLCMLSCSRA